jgi:hypothetical protein
MLRTPRRDRRRGNILIVTLALLALMAVVGLTAVYYTKDQAERARIQGQPKGGGEGFSADGTAPATHFLRTLTYDENDFGTGLLNSARGHSLVATMYGRKPGANIAWNGPGTFGGSPYNGADRRRLVNFRLFTGNVAHPEYDGDYAPGTTFPATYGATHYPKNPPYTYPDIKDFALASLCPATGEVIVPSFHRAAAFGSLDPSNPNWTSPEGKFYTLRPRRQEHPNFPPVPASEAGYYTGDVQNLPGGFFMSSAGQPAVARNDSIWIDTGEPVFRLPSGMRVKPLIAPLILDLDGRLNLNAHGNVLNAGSHVSGQGFGPWEINLSKVLGTDAATVLAARGVVATRSGLTSRAAFPSPRVPTGNELPRSAPVAWTGFTAATPLALPAATTTSYATVPTYTGGYAWTNTATPNHPSLYNPYEWGATGATKAFPVTDTKLLSSRYAPYRYDISQLSFASSATTSLVGTAGLPNPNPPGQGTGNPYRTDAAHTNRMAVTTVSNSLQRSMLMPGTGLPYDPNASPAGVNLGPIDLNRPLADYRDAAGTGAALSSSNVANRAAADAERQQFAADIFARLVAATAVPTADATISAAGAVTVIATAGTPGHTTLRQLAQLAVNIVDYIDSDDISTRFAWNTSVTTDVLYGVERPRLVINEAYGEVVNDPTDEAFTNLPDGMASKEAHVRFWVELQNPTDDTYTAATNGPLGDGSVAFGALKPYVLEIVANNKPGGSTVANRLRLASDTNYATNVTGESGAAPDVTFDFAPAGAMTVPPARKQATGGIVVVNPDVPAAPTDAAVAMAWLDFKYTAPTATPAPQKIDAPAVGGANAMGYKVTLPTTGDNFHNTADTQGAKFARNVVLLRRLANPYVAYDATTNPYLTVDALDHVRVADRLLVESGKKFSEKRSAAAMVGGTGFEAGPQSIGKVQPYASFADPAVAAPTALSYPTNTMVMPQTATATAPLVVKQTLGRQNSQAATAPGGPTTPADGGETIQTPFDWLVHLDRPLVNQTELLHVSAGRPHDLTYTFVGANNVKYGGSAQTVILANTVPQLYRAFDLLTVQPFGHQTALGGRMAGRININTIQDKRVWDALFDAQGFNGFDQAFVDNLWTQLMATRTVSMSTRTDVGGTTRPCPVPGATVHDTGGASGDRPFLPFGVATVAAGGATFGGGVGLDDTLMRRNPPGGVLPHIAVTSGTHPYQQAEALRKILNNTTTVSHTFAVWITVGYFEVESETATPVGGTFATLGKEYYINAPGDTRKKFFALVDRSNIGYTPSEVLTPPAPGTPYTQVDHPFFTTVEENAPAGTTIKVSCNASGNVYSDGVAVPLNGATIAIGVGANRDIVTVSNATAPVNGVTTLTVNPALARPHYAGESVSNIVPGNPGVPTDFDPTIAKYKAVVPLWVKLP